MFYGNALIRLNYDFLATVGNRRQRKKCAQGVFTASTTSQRTGAISPNRKPRFRHEGLPHMPLMTIFFI
jgi:hypothetical protein